LLTRNIPFASPVRSWAHIVTSADSSAILTRSIHLLLPFIKEGFERGEKAFHVIDPKRRDDHLRRLNSAGINVTQAEKSGQFELCNWEQMYLREGCFDQDGCSRYGGTCSRLPGSTVSPHPSGRTMEWALEDHEGVSDLLEYEARFNLMHLCERDAVICAYDLTRFGGDVIIGVLRTHPMVILGGVLQENPFFIPPEEFLHELREKPPSQSIAPCGELI